ncbi:hypothetical protein V1478_002979 [Vespula squamosa]|uniref:Uncharacterized protein n=1 Tax=Vespula squamosa TaxID=30214 RepID=A0ABD2BRD0_VESSQ
MSTTTRRVRRWRNVRSRRRNGPILKAAHEAPWRRATLISRKHGADGMPTGSDRTVLLPSVTSTVAHAAERLPGSFKAATPTSTTSNHELRYLDSASAGEHRFRSRKIVLDKKNENREGKSP